MATTIETKSSSIDGVKKSVKRSLEEIKTDADTVASNPSIIKNEDDDSPAQPTKIRKVVDDTKETETQTKKDIQVPLDNDVLCGRGGGTNNHVGNENFRVLVTRKKRDYLNSSKREKPLVSKSIVDEIRNMDPAGRFLQKNESTNLWYDIGDQKAREKTSQALREGAPEIRKELGVEGAKAKAELRELRMAGQAASANAMLVPMRGAQIPWTDIHGIPLARHGPGMSHDLAVDMLHRDHEHQMHRILPQYLPTHVHQLRLGDSKPYQGLNRLENPAGGPPLNWSPSQQQARASSQQFRSAHHQQQFPMQMRHNHGYLPGIHGAPLNRVAANSPQVPVVNGTQRQQPAYAQVRDFQAANSLPALVSSNVPDNQHKYWQKNQNQQLAANASSNGSECSPPESSKKCPNTDLLERNRVDAAYRNIASISRGSPGSTRNHHVSNTPNPVFRTEPPMKVTPLSKDAEYRLTVNDYITRITADGQQHKTDNLQMEAKLYQEAGLLGLDPDEMLHELKRGIAVQQLLSLKLGHNKKKGQHPKFDNSWATMASQSRVVSRENSTQDSCRTESGKCENDCLKIKSANTITQKRVVSALKSMGVAVLVENSA